MTNVSIGDYVETYVACWKRERLLMISEHLEESVQNTLDRLLEKYGHPSHPPEFRGWVGSLKIRGHTSPYSEEKMRAMTPQAVLEAIQNWEPPDSDWPGSDDLSVVGLAEAFEELVAKNAEAWVDLSEEIVERQLPTDYVIHYLRGLERALEQTDVKEADWSGPIQLCSLFTSSTHHNGDTSEVEAPRLRFQIILFIEKLSHLMLKEAERLKIQDILLTLSNDPNPSAENDGSYLESRDPSQVALDSTRPRALRALINLTAKTKQRFLEEHPRAAFKADQTLLDRLAEKLSGTSSYQSLSTHSVLGACLPNLYYIDKDWLTENLSRIFPGSSAQTDFFRCAFESYLLFSQFYLVLYDICRPYYLLALERLPGSREPRQCPDATQRLGAQIALAYFYGHEDLPNGKQESESPLSRLFEIGGGAIWAAAIWSLGKLIRENEKEALERHHWGRLRSLWKSRLELALKNDSAATFDREISEFAGWLSDLADQISFQELKPLLGPMLPHLARERFGRHRFEEYLSKVVQQDPQQVPSLLLQMLGFVHSETYYYPSPALRSVLLLAAEEGGEARETALDVIDWFGQNGLDFFKDIYEEHR